MITFAGAFIAGSLGLLEVEAYFLTAISAALAFFAAMGTAALNCPLALLRARERHLARGTPPHRSSVH